MSGISYDERVMGKEFDSKTFGKHGSLCQSLSGDESSWGGCYDTLTYKAG